MENYFILLGLSFDPIENDENIINEAINKKIQQWQNESKNPRKAIIAKENIAKIPEIKRIMLDSNLRKEEAIKALEYKEKIIKDIYYDVLIKSSKGTILTKEIDEIYNKYKSFNISKDDIIKQISVPIDGVIEQPKKEKEDFEIIDNNIISQLETYFKNLSIDDMSLYVFLKANINDDINKLSNMAEKKLQFLLQKGEKSTIDEMEQKISGIAKNIFSSNEQKKKYDNYLSGSRYYKINQLLKDGIKSNNNSLNINLYTLILKIMEDEYNIDKKESINYVNNYCKINKINIDPNIISELLIQQSQAPEHNKTVEKKPIPEIISTIKTEQNVVPDTPPKPIPKPSINYDEEFKKIVKPIEAKLIQIYKNFDEYQADLESYEINYIKYGRMPNKFALLFYIIILSISLFANIIFFISFGKTMHELIKYFIIFSTLFIFVDGIISIIFFKHVKNFYKYKNLMKITMKKYDITVKDEFNNHNITINDMKNDINKVKDYFDNVYNKCENLHIMSYNFKISANNTLCKFNVVPRCGFMLSKKILIFLTIIPAFYFIVLKFFPMFL